MQLLAESVVEAHEPAGHFFFAAGWEAGKRTIGESISHLPTAANGANDTYIIRAVVKLLVKPSAQLLRKKLRLIASFTWGGGVFATQRYRETINDCSGKQNRQRGCTVQ